MRNEIITGGVGTALSAIGTATQTNEVLQTISLIITILGSLLTFIVMPLLTWYKKAKQDGKIDADEIQEGIDVIVEGSKKVQDELDKKEGK